MKKRLAVLTLLGLTPLSVSATPITSSFENQRVFSFPGPTVTLSSAGTFALAKTADTLFLGTYGFGPSGSGPFIRQLVVAGDGVAVLANYSSSGPHYARQLAGSSFFTALADGTYAFPGGGSYTVGGNDLDWSPSSGEDVGASLGSDGVTVQGGMTKEDTTPSRGIMSLDPSSPVPLAFAPTLTGLSIPGHVLPAAPVSLSASALNVLPGLPVAGEFLLYEWDLDGDGTFDASGDSVSTSFVQGVHDVLLRVTNNYGFYSERSFEVTSSLPEPGTLLLVGLGLLGAFRRRG